MATQRAVQNITRSVANSDTIPLGIVLVSKQCGYCKTTLAELNKFLKTSRGQQFKVIVLERSVLQGVENALMALAGSKTYPPHVSQPLRQIASEIGKLRGFPTFIRQLQGANDLVVDQGAKTQGEICRFLAGNLAHLRCPN